MAAMVVLAHGIAWSSARSPWTRRATRAPRCASLLRVFFGLAGTVMTIDATHTQHDTAQVILGRNAVYLMTVKGNMPTLHRQLKKLSWARIPSCPRMTRQSVPHKFRASVPQRPVQFNI